MKNAGAREVELRELCVRRTLCCRMHPRHGLRWPDTRSGMEGMVLSHVLPHHSVALNRDPWIVIDNAKLGRDAEARTSQETGRFDPLQASSSLPTHESWPEECGNRLFAIPFACLSLHEPARRPDPEHWHVYGTAHLSSSIQLPSHDGPCPGPSRE